MKLKGTILLESVIAMIVVMLCFGIAAMIYNNVVSGSREKLRVIARIRLEQEALRAKAEERLLDETIESEEFRVERKIVPYPGSQQLYELKLTAVAPDGKQLAEYHELLRQP